ncbi:MAG TPA: bifunctional UDP-N-acetylglucosamine diphosphorylase/glucosamine-1-phosphate N-acetyltransferase GlmU [Stellaceae bacterium]|nr:bifunctional UDP-N-acetylglucosamine diphosphorylase/glucosamine-1-phosphate N-acetyltransferase GlmU [Stellaceae bacterium]
MSDLTSPHAAIVLAAGEGTRMRSKRPKVLHEVAHRAMIGHVLDQLAELAPARTLVVIGKDMAAVAGAVHPAETVVQSPPLGTGHAVKVALDRLGGCTGSVLVVYGDAPLITAATLGALLAELRRAPGAAVAVLGMRPADPGPYGRLVLGAGGSLEAIVEARDASDAQRAIGLCNSGVMALDGRHAAELVNAIGSDNAKKEFYLTDVVALARRRGLLCRALEAPAEELLGVNSRLELAAAEALMQHRLRRRHMAAGVTLIDPVSVFFSADTEIGRDTVIEPSVVFGPGVVVGEAVEIRAMSHIVGATIGDRAVVGPFARLRPGAELGPEVHVGNFVEIKSARLGPGSKANHLSYVGDAVVGGHVNIGAGTITCNYDGFLKSITRIEDGAFIGSNTSLVAPVKVGANAIVGAGSVIVSDVPADALAIARGAQVDKPGRARKLREQGAAAKARAKSSPKERSKV